MLHAWPCSIEKSTVSVPLLARKQCRASGNPTSLHTLDKSTPADEDILTGNEPDRSPNPLHAVHEAWFEE